MQGKGRPADEPEGYQPEEAAVMLPDISRDRPHDSDQDAPVASEQLAREQAIKQTGRRRRFWFWAVLVDRKSVV